MVFTAGGKDVELNALCLCCGVHTYVGQGRQRVDWETADSDGSLQDVSDDKLLKTGEDLLYALKRLHRVAICYDFFLARAGWLCRR